MARSNGLLVFEGCENLEEGELVAMMKIKGCSDSYLRLCPPCRELENVLQDMDEGNFPEPNSDDVWCAMCDGFIRLAHVKL